jgi:hypothetical protein
VTEVSLSDLELSILAWPLSERPVTTTTHITTMPGGPTERFRQQIDTGLLQSAVAYLRQELEQQQAAVNNTRRQLPKGWYKQSNPTVDLEVIADGLAAKRSINLPKIWPQEISAGQR